MSAPISPGPAVYATASRSFGSMAACARTCRTIGASFAIWSRDASSGTTPPNGAWIAVWVASASATRPRRVSYNATPVSSQLVSMPRTSMVGGSQTPLYTPLGRGVRYPARMAGPPPSFNQSREYLMPSVRVRESEHFDAALRRFKRACEKAGILTELRRREYYEKPTQERKRKKAAAIKRHMKRNARTMARRRRLY